MVNAKEELLAALEGRPQIKCARIKLVDYSGDPKERLFKLKVGHTNKDLEVFLNSLDFSYGAWEDFFGTVWFDDGTWLSRAGDDMGTWWEYHTLPEIPSELM